MRLFFIVLLLSIGFGAWSQVPDTKTHKVQSGETKYGISRQYGITIETLEKYNPDILNGLKAGMMLLIPIESESKPEVKQEPQKPDGKKLVHTVKKGETLYSLSRTYEVELSELQKLNPELKNGGLKEGMVLLIPAKKPQVEVSEPDTNYYWHQVKVSETAWLISKTYEISLDSLYLLNPEAENGLSIGQKLKLPLNRKPKPRESLATDNQFEERKPVEGEKLADTVDGYVLYPVKAGDTFYNLKQRFLTSREELIDINPELSEGLKVDNYILIPIKQEKLPSNFFDKIFNNKEIVGPDTDPSLEQYQTRDSLNKGEEISLPKPTHEDTLTVDIDKHYRVAVVLPFYSSIDTTRYEDGIHPQSAVAIDFYNAFMLAADTLAKQGMHLQLKVYDTENNASRVKRIISELKSDEPDLIIGPLFKNHVERVAESMEDSDVKVVSPLSRTVVTTGHPNLIKCIPGEAARVAEFAFAINRYYLDANLIFLEHSERDGTDEARQLSELIARINPSEGPSHVNRYKVVSVDGDLGLDSILELAISDTIPNLVVTLSEDKVFLSTLVGELRGGTNRDSAGVRLLAPSRLMGINTLDFNYLNDLEVTMPNNDFVDYRDSSTTAFITRYRAKYLEEPSKYAFQGYDVGMFFLSKLWYTGPHFDRSIQTEERMISTGFNIRPTAEGGYENNFLLLTRIKDYELVLVREPEELLD
jgi:LysM repeat protein